MSNHALTLQESEDRRVFEAMLGCWEHTLIASYTRDIEHTGNDERTAARIIQALESCFRDDAVPPTHERLQGAITQQEQSEQQVA